MNRMVKGYRYRKPSFARIVATITMIKANRRVRNTSTKPTMARTEIRLIIPAMTRIRLIIPYMVTLIWKFIDSLPCQVYERRLLSFN